MVVQHGGSSLGEFLGFIYGRFATILAGIPWPGRSAGASAVFVDQLLTSKKARLNARAAASKIVNILGV